MDPFKKRDELRTEAKNLTALLAAENRNMTAAEAERVKAIAAELAPLDKTCDAIEAQTKALDALNDSEAQTKSTKAAASHVGGSIRQKIADAVAAKGVGPSGKVSVTTKGGIVTLDRAKTSILGILGGESITTATYEYLRQKTRTLLVDSVAMGGVKPTSTFEWEMMSARVATIAHVSNPIARQMIADHAALTKWLAEEMGYGVELAFADFVLNGGTDEAGNHVVGVLEEAAGIPTSPFVTSDVLSIRRALTTLENNGTDSTAIVLNPDDWEAIETSRYPDGKYILGGPNTRTPRILWDLPVVTDESIPEGLSLVGQFREGIELLPREDLEITWNESGELFTKNQVQFRAEARGALAIPKPQSMRLVGLTATALEDWAATAPEEG